MIGWGFDGCDATNNDAYHHAAYVFAEGPFFYSMADCKDITRRWASKIRFAHPYYDVFSQFTQEECQKKLGIDTDKQVILVAETGNIAKVETRWTPLYRKIIRQIPRDLFYVVFKAREKTTHNPCRETIGPYVDKYIENEWIYPPCSAVAAIASDICILPCESRYVLEVVMSKKPIIMHSQGTYKNKRQREIFASMVNRYKFNAWSSLRKGSLSSKKAKYNYAAATAGWSVTMHSGGNCDFILKTVLEHR